MSKRDDLRRFNEASLKVLTFKQWFKVYWELYGEGASKLLALGKMMELAESLDEWLSVFELTLPGSEFEKIAKSKLLGLAKTFDEWKFVCEPISFLCKPRTGWLAIEKMSGLAKSYDEWKFVYRHTPTGNDIHLLAYEEMRKTANTPHDTFYVTTLSPY